MECQFDQNDKLKSSVNKSFDADELRVQPIGRDLDGFIYWYHEVRLFPFVISINLIDLFYQQCHSLIGYVKHYSFVDSRYPSSVGLSTKWQPLICIF